MTSKYVMTSNIRYDEKMHNDIKGESTSVGLQSSIVMFSV